MIKEQIEKMRMIVGAMYDIAIELACSRTYGIPYDWIEDRFGVDLSDTKIQSDIRDAWCSGEHMDLISDMDFDNTHKEVYVMTWETGKGNDKMKVMKRYELKDYKEFCREALVCPPIEEFENGTIDEDEWYREHYIKISTGNHEINIGYGADEVNEIEFTLREIYEAVEGGGEATTGNTFGSQYRPAELKDVVRWFIMYRYENWGGLNWFDYAKQAVEELKDLQSVIGIYEHAKRIEKDIAFKCNWHNFKMESLKDATEDGIKKIILDWVGSDIEISYDSRTDKSFIVDFTFKDSGDFIDWCWGRVDENDDGFNVLLESYKACIFE